METAASLHISLHISCTYLAHIYRKCLTYIDCRYTMQITDISIADIKHCFNDESQFISVISDKMCRQGRYECKNQN